MKASEIMTSSPHVCSSTDSIADVARLMRDHDCGAVPIVDNGSVVGIVTDRDLAIRALAENRGPDTRVSDVMTASPSCCSADDDVRDVEKMMAGSQVRRVPIVDQRGSCLGIISQADLARAAFSGDRVNERVSEREVAIVVDAISQPARGSRDRNARSEAEQRL